MVSKETDISLRTYLARLGLRKGALSRFVEEAVRWRVMDRTVSDTKSRNALIPPGELTRVIEESVQSVRKDRTKTHAHRS